jgi:hypothetical protein
MKTAYISFTTIFFLGLLPITIFAQQEPNQFSLSDTTVTVDLNNFLEEIREITIRYHDIQQAKRDGYVLFGPDMPNMGEHYVSPVKAVSRDFNFNRPSVLCYLPVGDKHLLTGVAYTFPAAAGDPPPRLPLEEMNWHYHAGDLELEAHGITENNLLEKEPDKPRLAMLHAWIWSKNPDGIFTADHWGLSYMRLGLEIPSHADPDASRALFLLFDGIEYYTRFVELAAAPDGKSLENIQSILNHYSKKVELLASSMKERQMVTDKDQDTLKSIWNEMWLKIKGVVSKGEWEKINTHLSNFHNH